MLSQVFSMQVVYDPSVLVRSELAVLYSRYVRGHAALVQVRCRREVQAGGAGGVQAGVLYSRYVQGHAALAQVRNHGGRTTFFFFFCTAGE